MFEGFPYTNFHDLNLDWIIQKVKEAYSPDNPPTNIVLSVNGETGDVILYPDAVIRFPDVNETVWNIHRITDDTSTGIQFIKDNPAQRINGIYRYDIYDSGNPPPYPVTSVNGQTGNIQLYENPNVRFPDVSAGDWNIHRVGDETSTGIQFRKNNPAQRINGTDRYNIYDEGNPPPYPVTSVNGHTGNVNIDIPVNSVGGLTGSVIILDTEIVTESGTQKIKILFPVSTVDGQTGNVTTWGYTNSADLTVPLSAEGDGWGIIREIPSGEIGVEFEYDDSTDEITGYIKFTPDGSQTTQRIKILTPNDIPSSSGVVSVNGENGVVTLTGSNINVSSSDTTKIAVAIGNIYDMIATNYDPTTTYYLGSYCRYNGSIYKAIATTTGAWDSTKWNLTNVGNELKTKANDSVITATPEYGATATHNYTTGAYILINGILNKAIANISSGDAFSASNVSAVTVGSELSSLNAQIANIDTRITHSPIIYNFAQGATAKNIVFSGSYTVQTRCFAGFVVVEGQSDIKNMIAFGFTGNGDVSTPTGIKVASNSNNISSNGMKINIPLLGDGWGRITVVLFYSIPGLSVTIEEA